MAAALTMDPAMLQMAASFPLARMAMFPGSPFTAEALAGLVEAANK
jgi:beta-glucosidase